ncbi:MAG: hypothetical protein H6641_08710 [Caldilineaceae bacterium]|nr:hypothetical protein [Caldilineaceae bacterium]
MESTIRLVATYAPWIYAMCGLVALYHIYKVWQVRAERRQAIFSLEREKATRELSNIFVVALLLVVTMALTYFASVVLGEAITPETVSVNNRAISDIPTGRLPTPTSIPLTATATLTATLAAPTDTPTPEESPTVVVVLPTDTPPPVVSAASCPDPRALITNPANGAVLSGAISMSGTAVHEQFQFYKVEYASGAGAQEGFVYLFSGNSPVNGGLLGSFNTSSLNNGVWTLKLTVVDVTGNFPEPCYVTVTIQN